MHARGQPARSARTSRRAKRLRSGESELLITLAFLRASAQSEQDPPYHSIVALGEHAAVLHYQHRDPTPPRPPRSLLVDAGATCFAYAADITRTHAAAGETLFADLIAAMDAIERRLAAAAQPGTSFVELHERAHRAIAELMLDCGLARGRAAKR